MTDYFTDIEDGDTAAITTVGSDLIATSTSGTTEPVSQSYIDTYLRPATADETTAYLAAIEQKR
ncbi:hypothetical protein [Rhodococcus sp. 1168]|uniref:hypothetical protein n=1 Tax=Rhodococcus sp. 1168 TaxID=2018041 RepID=UPI000A0CC207|nr:hypothetical protein [Rhodococcus sp. 1168]ORI13428.1 hypothetical protein BJI47_22555 [Rhodococcus sp. 1168]